MTVVFRRLVPWAMARPEIISPRSPRSLASLLLPDGSSCVCWGVVAFVAGSKEFEVVELTFDVETIDQQPY